jgi:2-dehydro-3-deoxyglucarate aldolase/4-hydroxy-2-oxoheptanedioate aldolase
MSIIAPNRLKQTLQNGQSAVGILVVEIRQPSLMQVLANAGFQFVIIDGEHGSHSPETIADLSRAANLLALTPIVRVPDLAYPFLAHALDAGAQGIMLPRVFNVEQVKKAVQMIKYPPQGIRGNAQGIGYTRFQSGPVKEVMARVNEESMLVIQIETREALENIEDIVSVPGVDVALVGPNDLSISLGIPGQIDAPAMREGIEKVIAACRRYGVYPAIHTNNLDIADHWIKKGMRMISSHDEMRLITKAGLKVTEAINQSFKNLPQNITQQEDT